MKLRPNPASFKMSLGDRGEAVACSFLQKSGYKILEKNYRCKLGEIDVIARREGRIAFIEIKTRTSERFGAPQEAVDPSKQAKILKVAEWYLKEKKCEEAALAFDVVAVLWKEGHSPEMVLIRDAFEKENKPS